MEAGTASRGRGRGESLDQQIANAPGYERLESVAGMWDLFVRTVKATFRRPYTWPADFRAELAVALKRSFLPTFLSVSFFSIGLVIVAIAGVLEVLGTSDRAGGGMATGWARETGFWVTSMVFAGVVGSSITADLGARKIREELDALAVLGVDQVKTLVVPRVLALAVAAPILGMMAVLIGAGWVYVLGPLMVANLTDAAFLQTVQGFIDLQDYISFILRLIVTGTFVGVVACYKGLSARGGAEGVGRAVNECVLITFISMWVLNSLWNAVLLSQFPITQVLRG